MKHILLFGAGKSATVLIDYLKEISADGKYKVTIADADLQAAQEKTGSHTYATAVSIDVNNDAKRKALIETADVVISLLPPALHYLVALDCVACNKHLLTASYIDERIKALAGDIKDKNLLFLCEMGLDPGIDHMSAMQMIDRIKSAGGKITTFKSHCGGLVAPENDDNPWHYKISWNPKNIIMAGKDGAIYRENGRKKNVSYNDLFNSENLLEVPGINILSYYPNRDSLSYIPLYNLPEAKTFIRTTLRHPDFTFGWKNIVDLRLTDENEIYDTDGMTIADFFKMHFEKYGFSEWLNEMLNSRLSYAKDLMENLLELMETEKELEGEGKETDDSIMMVNEKGELDMLEIDQVKDQAAASLAIKMHEANLSLKQLFFLGIDSEESLNLGKRSAAEVLQYVLEQKLALKNGEKDMVVMMHEIVYELNGEMHNIKSTMIVIGEDNVRTAMAKTVGLPLGIAARLILEGKITETGLHIPVTPAIYELILPELEKQGVFFSETKL